MRIKYILSFAFVFMFLSTFSRAENVTLCYHAFDYSLKNIYSVLPEVFEAHVKYLKENNVKIIPIKELADIYSSTAGVIPDSALLTIDDGNKNVNNIIPFIQRERVPVTLFIYPGVINRKPGNFNADDINRLKQLDLIDFGCHSYTHPMLSKSADSELYMEIVKSKKRVAQMTGREIDTFAYPFGSGPANKKVKEMVSQNYRLAYGVFEGSNTINTDKYHLKRTIIYRSTTFGEFIEIIENGLGRQVGGYTVKNITENRNKGKALKYTRIKIYKYPPEEMKKTVLIVPDSGMGAGWAYKIINSLNRSGVQSFAVVNRNNNIPYYRAENNMGDIKNWGLSEYVNDLKDALSYACENNRKIVVLTYGDGFDVLMSVLSGALNYKNMVEGIIAINPSIKNESGKKEEFSDNIRRYDSLLRRGEFSTMNYLRNLKIKTLSDLMVLEPEEISPFGKEMGYENITNKELFLKTLKTEGNPDFDIDFSSGNYTADDLKEAFLKPLPLFPFAVPVKLKRDINNLWFNDFVLQEREIRYTREIDYPVVYYYNSAYRENMPRIANAFLSLRIVNQHDFGEESTAGIMLSDNVVEMLTQEVIKISQ